MTCQHLTRKVILLLALMMLSSCACRSVRIAEDITPGNISCDKLDWRYGAKDIRIQTTKLNKQLMDRWLEKSGYNLYNGKPVL